MIASHMVSHKRFCLNLKTKVLNIICKRFVFLNSPPDCQSDAQKTSIII